MVEPTKIYREDIDAFSEFPYELPVSVFNV